MIDRQKRRVQERPFRTAFVRQRLPMERTIVNAFAAQGRACLAQMDAHLMRAPGLQSALEQREVAERFHDADLCDRVLSFGCSAGAASAVAAIREEIRL